MKIFSTCLLSMLVMPVLAHSTSTGRHDQELSLVAPACVADQGAWKRYMAEAPNRLPSQVFDLLWTDLNGDGICDAVLSMAPEFDRKSPEGKLLRGKIVKNYGCVFLNRRGEFESSVPGQGTLSCTEAERALYSAMPIYSKVAKKTFLVVFEYSLNNPTVLSFDATHAEEKLPHANASVMRFYLRSLLRLQRDFIAAYPARGSEGSLSKGQLAAGRLDQEVDGVTGWKAGDLLGLPQQAAEALVEQIRAEVAGEAIGTGTGIGLQGAKPGAVR